MRSTIAKEEDSYKYVEVYVENVLKRDNIRWQVIVVWESPFEKKYSSRTAFFSERTEADIYEKFLCDTYDKYGFDYKIDIFYIGKD